MKNKEIEELLKFLKEPFGKEKTHKAIDKKDTKLLLSYIEQLEKRIYKARKMIFDNYGVLDKYGIEMLDDILKGDSDE